MGKLAWWQPFRNFKKLKHNSEIAAILDDLTAIFNFIFEIWLCGLEFLVYFLKRYDRSSIIDNHLSSSLQSLRTVLYVWLYDRTIFRNIENKPSVKLLAHTLKCYTQRRALNSQTSFKKENYHSRLLHHCLLITDTYATVLSYTNPCRLSTIVCHSRLVFFSVSNIQNNSL